MPEIGALLKHTLFQHCGNVYQIETHCEATRTTLARNKSTNKLEEFSNIIPVDVVRDTPPSDIHSDRPPWDALKRVGEIPDPEFNWQNGQATKHDASKPRYDLLPPEALEEIAKVLAWGASKYEDRNWEKGTNYSRYFSATMRHLWAWWRGENLDPESGLSHLAHAGCCILFLLSYVKWGHQTTDDRPRRG